MSVGAEIATQHTVASKYYDAYGAYISFASRYYEGGRSGDSAVSAVEGGVFGVVPPVWVGYRAELPSSVSGVGGGGGGVLGDAPVCAGSSPVSSDAVGDAPVGSVFAATAAGVKVASVDDVCEGVGSKPVYGRHHWKNVAKRERRRVRSTASGRVDGSGGCVSDGSGSTVVTVDTRTAVEIEAAQTLAERRVAENRLAVVQANARVASYADKDKSKALERLHAARLSQRINQANAAANRAYDARDKSPTSVDSAGSAGEYALRQEIKAARNSQFLNEYLRKQNDILARYAGSVGVAAADRVPKPKFDDAYEIMKDQYDCADPERVAQLDADVAVENARWNDVLNSGEGFVDEPATVRTPEGKETLEELYAKVRAQNEQFDIAQREIDAANQEN